MKYKDVRKKKYVNINLRPKARSWLIREANWIHTQGGLERPQAETGSACVACRGVPSIIKSSVFGCQN